MIKLSVPSIEEEDLQAVREVLASGYLIQGPHVAEFEKAVAEYVGTKYAVAVSNCTAALHIALLSIAVRPGDLVIVTSYSWLSTANVIELCGAKPVFIDICHDTFNMDPNCLERTLENLMNSGKTARRVKAVLPVHTFGQLANMEKISRVASRYDLRVIEDAACALGAEFYNRQAGSLGIMGCFSFHPRKAITTGEGGIITTNNANLLRRLCALRNHGQDPNASTPDFITPGFNYRMTDFQAALGNVQLSKLDRIISARRKAAETYNYLLESTNVQTPRVEEGCKPVYQSYVVLLPESIAIKRNAIIKQLKKKGIETTIGTWNMPMTTYFRSRYGYKANDFPIAERVFARALSLPIYENIKEAEQKEIVHCLKVALTSI